VKKQSPARPEAQAWIAMIPSSATAFHQVASPHRKVVIIVPDLLDDRRRRVPDHAIETDGIDDPVGATLEGILTRQRFCILRLDNLLSLLTTNH
jgi:hypothetical protein